MSNSNEALPRMPGAILIASVVGLGAVSSVSALAGYAIAPGVTKAEMVIVALSVMILIILPYFLLRETVLESREPPLPAALQIVHLTAAASWSGAALLAWFNRNDILLLGSQMHLFMLVGALIPFMYLYGRLTFSAKDMNDEHRIFARRVLVPSLFACVMPFLYGWTIALPSNFPLVVSITGILLVIWDLSSNSVSLKMHLLGLLVLMFLSAVLAYAVGPDFRALTFGCLMTLAMGATEVAKRVHLTAAGRIPAHPDESDDYYLKGANWSLVVFPLGLLFLPFLVSDFPAWAACAAAFVQIAGWSFLSKDRKRSVSAYRIAIFAGFSVPILVVIGTKFPQHQSLLKVDLFSSMSLIIGTALGLIAAFNTQKQWRRFVKSLQEHDTFLDDKNCRNFALASILICGIAVFVIADSMAKITQDTTYAHKGSDIAVFLVFLATFIYIFHPGSKMPPSKDPEQNSTPVKANVINEIISSESTTKKSKLRLILITARWPISIIAGVPVFAGFLANGVPITETILVSSSMTLSVAAAFLLNDYFDYKKDKIACVNRPVSNGDLSLAVALTTGLCLLGISSFLAASATSTGILITSITVNVCVFLYSYISRLAPLTKGIVTAALCATPFLYVSVATNGVWLTPQVLILFLFVWGRELVMDAMEIRGDILSGIHTLAARIGESNAKKLGWIVMIFSSALLIIFTKGYSQVISIFCLSLLMLAKALFRRNENLGISTSRASMFLGSLAIAINVSS